MSEQKRVARVSRIVLPLVILGVAAAAATWFIKTKPVPGKRKKPDTASVVEFLSVTSDRHKVTVAAMGTVSPVEEVVLQSEVTGLIVWKHPNLVPGGMVKRNETLLRLDARNYEAVVKQQEAALEKAVVEYELESSRSEVAAEEWKMIHAGKEADTRARKLALREPQLRAAQALVAAARSSLSRARLDVERTQIAAPFNAVVLDEFVDRGQSVSPSTRLARLAGTDTFRVEVSLPVRELRWMKRPDDSGENGPSAAVIHELGESEQLRFDGTVTRVLSSLGEAGRMARVLVDVQDPLGLTAKNVDRTRRLLADAYVRVLIEGIGIDDVFEVPGGVIREGKRLWVMNAEDRLEIRDVEVVWRQGGRALVRGGLHDGERVIISHLPAPVPGMKLRAKSGGKTARGKGKPGT